MGFLLDYFDITDEKTEVPVCCPFPHYTPSGLEYQESRASAHVNTEEGLFHCKVCGESGSEITMISKLLGCSSPVAHKLQRCFNSDETVDEWDKEMTLTDATKNRALNLGISEAVINELKIKTPTYTEDIMAFPVFMYDHLIDIRQYNPGGSPKIKSRKDCPSGLIIPFNEWKDTDPSRTTILCAGEKDMAIARTMGFNAITLTGGEQCLPATPKFFKDRIVAICYDNDTAGITGAYKVANAIFKYTSYVKIITKFHEGMEEKEDITDYFTKYKKTKEDLIQCIEATPWYTGDKLPNKNYPVMDLLKASSPNYVGKIVKSNVQVVAISEATFSCPSHIYAEKIQTADGVMSVGDFKEWQLDENNAEDILHLIDNNFREDAIKKNYRKLLGLLDKEKYVRIDELEKITVFKCYLTDLFETSNTTNHQPMEYMAYSIDTKLESGKKYMITYKLVPHPYKGRQLVMIILDTEQANDSVTDFKLTDSVKESLKTIQEIPGTIAEKVNTMTEKIKGILGYDGINTLIQTVDFAYNTPLQFNFGTFKNVRAYLDTIIVGESRTGKSSTADCLRQLYGLGTFTSLAGNSATIPGLVGGSNKTSTGFQTRAGIIPQNHKGLVIFEEFGKSNSSVITELTDIRSSNEVRITRVAGTITMPAMVRMISLTNPKNKNGNIRSIASYPNGIEVLKDLVETAEDIARYDMIVILPDRGNAQIDPMWSPEEPLQEQVYRDKIRWVWSRTPEQIVINRDIQLYIIEITNKLNKEYDSHIKIFGTEAWKKLSRLAIAVAAYTCSTDDSYENIIVKREHVDYAKHFLVNLYDNPTFGLRRYIQTERQYTEIDDEGIAALQDMYNKEPMLILQLEQYSTTSRNILMSVTGMENKDLSVALSRLTRLRFIQHKGYDIIPTERFRRGLSTIERNTYAPRLGEINVQVPVDKDEYPIPF
ncbi:MAG: ATP-binding protein [Pseudobutyrivibrio sp.]|nr:ATP-binding protein [Pseudobutyrivibrio sp.]